jgi:YjbE family integral membrane protein
VLTIVAVELLRLPFLKLIGAVLLGWIAIQLLVPEDENEGGDAQASGLGAAIKTILIADLVMSLDNVIAVAAAAKGSTALLVIGLAISIPLVVFASQLLLTLMDRFPIIITLGAALLGWVAGDMAVSDPVVKTWVDTHAAFLHWAAPSAFALGVVLFGKWVASRKKGHLMPSAAADAAAGSPAALPVSTKRILLATDGSEYALRALEQVLAMHADRGPGAAPELHLLNVQRPLSGEVTRFVSGQAVDDYLRERSNEAMAPVRAILQQAKVPFEEHVAIGEPGPSIADAARTLGCGLIVIGARGLGAAASALIGSVAQSTIAEADVPVLVVK